MRVPARVLARAVVRRMTRDANLGQRVLIEEVAACAVMQVEARPPDMLGDDECLAHLYIMTLSARRRGLSMK
ncbi:uncharacterized protein GLRG_10398 [Colletotrichum graminicola M1.001]|uniref:Uncharacterized protein n=1 Tax=Colletotrichum graminicola (strain M1.001 / M2 / FGSC 10212) TaxID=645133 RepID=E3QWL6_COLGM|nr:uncharacterized protein GLRG_10398 [Colletotrichum graminicola M1.001]EFQ35254.1 hypothetical protein GLRG_10398 [Colletotrichum graminicola M1.001]